MLLLPVAAGYAAGPDRGAVFGFITGLVADLFLPTPFGLSALVGCLLGFATGIATRGLVRSSWWLPPVVAAAATAAGMGAYAILGAVLGDPAMLRTYLVPALVVGTPSAALLAVPGPALGGVGGARAGPEPRRSPPVGACGEDSAADASPWSCAAPIHPDDRPARLGPRRAGSATPCGAPTSIRDPRRRARRGARSPAGPRMRPRRTVVDRVMAVSEPSAPRTVIRLRVLGVVVAALFSLMFIRLWYLQVLDTSAYSKTVTANQIRNVEVAAPRGLITDRNDNIIVGDQVTQDITLSQGVGPGAPRGGGAAGRAARDPVGPDRGRPRQRPVQLVQARAHPRERPALRRPLHRRARLDVPRGVHRGRHQPHLSPRPDRRADARVRGPDHEPRSSRPIRPRAISSATSSDRAGSRRSTRPALRGRPGVDKVEVDAHGQVVGSLGETPPTAGDDVVTNIDAGLEQTLQQATRRRDRVAQGQVHRRRGGGPRPPDRCRPGPRLDADLRPHVVDQRDLHRRTSARSRPPARRTTTPSRASTPRGRPSSSPRPPPRCRPGSSRPGYTYNDTGAYTIPGCATGGAGCATYHDNEGEVGGRVNVSQALTVSSDIFFYNLGVAVLGRLQSQRTLRRDPIQDAAAQLGYGDVTGIDLPDETHVARVDSPKVVEREHAQDPKDYPNSGWFTGNNLELAFGQGGTVITPIEQAVAYATFANGGTRYVPEVAAGLVNAHGKVVQDRRPQGRRAHQLSRRPTTRPCCRASRASCRTPRAPPRAPSPASPCPRFPLAGKTGTATTNEQQPNSWFVAWGPVPDPQYLIAVVVQGGGLGSQAAAPVVRQGFDYLVAHPESPAHLAPATTPATPLPPPTTTTTTSPGPEHVRGTARPPRRRPRPSTKPGPRPPHGADRRRGGALDSAGT